MTDNVRIFRTDGKPVTLPKYLRDGDTHRTPMMARDGYYCDLCGNTGVVPESSTRCPVCSAKGIVHGDRALVTDAEVQMHIARDGAWRTETAGSRAGFRYAADSEATRAGRQALHDSYAQHEQYITSAWQTLSSNVAPPTVASNTDVRPVQTDGKTTDQIAKDHQERMAEETRLYEQSVANAYKTLR